MKLFANSNQVFFFLSLGINNGSGEEKKYWKSKTEEALFQTELKLLYILWHEYVFFFNFLVIEMHF